MTELKIRNLTEPQIAAFREVLPALDRTGLVTSTKSTLTIKHHPDVFRAPEFFTGRALARAVQLSKAEYTGKLSVLHNLIAKLREA
jgi:hypothetical protein